MPRPKIDPERRRVHHRETMLTRREADALRQACDGMPVSEFIRNAILPLIRPWMKR